MLGLGANKAKLLASADKNVKQGKLQNAIADYERVIAEDPRDLNVLNTIGDLYARLGNVDQATTYFQRVGDAYASEGFTVKAIAVYKKLTKQNPKAWEVMRKLADLYAQQGLNSDARVQYTAVAEQYMRTGDTGAAVTVFQKILEIDPDNPQLQARLADLYVRLGKKTEARDVYFRAAQGMRARGSLEACDTALGRVLELDRSFSQALMMRAEVRLERDDAKGAVQCLESIPDLDSKADGLRLLLNAYLKTGHTAEAEPLARKLLTIFNDVSPISTYIDALIASGDHKGALAGYQEHAAKLLAADAKAAVQTLNKLVGPLKDDARALETISDLFQQAGDTTHLTEITELLAHASVQNGELAKARDLYKKLSELEPDNPLHLQNYTQIAARLGERPAASETVADHGRQPLTLEDPEQPAPLMAQGYSPNITAAVRDALTDAELFASYNLPARAIPPLEAILPRVPRDVEVNQRLTSLYVRTGRLTDAAERCQVLKAVYADAGLKDEARQYDQLSKQYSAGKAVEPGPAPAVPPMAASTAAGAPAPGKAVAETRTGSTKPMAPPVPAGKTAEAPASPGPSGRVPPSDAVAHEIDLSEEWERVLTADKPGAPAVPQSSPAGREGRQSTTTPASTDAAVGDIIEEVRFYLSQSMLEQARGAFARAEAMSPNAPAVIELRTQLAAHPGMPAAAVPEKPIAPTPSVSHFPVNTPAALNTEILSEMTARPVPSGAAAKASPATGPGAVLPEWPAPGGRVPAISAPATAGAAAASKPRGAAPTVGDLLGDFVIDLEQSLGADFHVPAPGTKGTPVQAFAATPVAPTAPRPVSISPPPPPAIVRTNANDQVLDGIGLNGNGLAGLFAEFKQDLEASSTDNEDPETHYNLGVAFKEMGLLDEAIGELQKVCTAIDSGRPFSQVIEAYTWLADCFVQNGVPEAGVHWYEKALRVPGVGDERSLAMHYELACAHEAAGDMSAAREHFMHVLSRNIDYRDVAERIKGLKS